MPATPSTWAATLLARLNPGFLKLLALVLAVLVLASAASYLVPSCQRKADVRQAVAARAAHAASQQQHQAATTHYRLDSTRLAEHAWLLHQQDSLLRQEDAHLSPLFHYPQLPAYEQLPREGAGPAD